MNAQMVEKSLEACRQRIELLPASQRKKLMTLYRESCDRHRQLVQDTTEALDALSEWRIWAKYRLFDLEARQREAKMTRRQDPNESDLS